jgi:hypothetical protein
MLIDDQAYILKIFKSVLNMRSDYINEYISSYIHIFHQSEASDRKNFYNK